MKSFVYSQEQVNAIVNMLDKVTVSGINNFTLLASIANIIDKAQVIEKEEE